MQCQVLARRLVPPQRPCTCNNATSNIHPYHPHPPLVEYLIFQPCSRHLQSPTIIMMRFLELLLRYRLTLLLSLAARVCGSPQTPLNQHGATPNIVFFLTDDQDVHMDSLAYMPNVKRHITGHGTSFQRHYCTVALCCPSRASLWTGKAAHNTNITDLNPPYGGYPKFVSQGFNKNYLPLWLQSAGYNTYYIGKLFNAHSTSTYNKPHAAGWTGSDFLLDPYTYEYYNATFQRNFDPPVSYEGFYSTDVVAEKSYGYLDEALNEGRSFFITIAPTAPHSNVHINVDMSGGDGNWTGSSAVQSMPRPAERHKDLFKNAKVPRTPNFNPQNPSGASWILDLPRQNQTNVDYNDEWYRNRLRTLQAVDEMVDGVVKRLEEAGVLDNTYLIFSTDNGYSIGQHRRQPGKQCAFEGDINVPLVVRGPGVPKGKTTDIVTSHTDLAPTFLEIAGVNVSQRAQYELDGSAIPLRPALLEQSESTWAHEHVNVEMWGIIMSEGKYGYILYPNHTYKALRIVGEGFSLLYTVWCSNEHELYDLIHDPWQMDNIYDPADPARQFTISPEKTENRNLSMTDLLYSSSGADGETNESSSATTTTVKQLISRLDALLLVLKTCRMDECRFPWNVVHPAGDVHNLRDALDPKFDHFYQTRPKVQYERCEKGYIPESEGVMWHPGMSFGAMDQEVWLGS